MKSFLYFMGLIILIVKISFWLIKYFLQKFPSNLISSQSLSFFKEQHQNQTIVFSLNSIQSLNFTLRQSSRFVQLLRQVEVGLQMISFIQFAFFRFDYKVIVIFYLFRRVLKVFNLNHFDIESALLAKSIIIFDHSNMSLYLPLKELFYLPTYCKLFQNSITNQGSIYYIILGNVKNNLIYQATQQQLTMIVTKKPFSDFTILKVSDGLFLGNSYAAQDIAFLYHNKVKLIVNCAPQQVNPPVSENIDLINYSWIDEQNKLLEYIQQNKISQITTKIQKTLQGCQGVLICSKKGQSRCLTMCILYFINRFSWSLFKSLQFINSRKSDLEIRAVFLQILAEYENNLKVKFKTKLTDKWFQNQQVQGQELLMTNTYINSQKNQKLVVQNQQKSSIKKSVKIIFTTEIICSKQQQQRLNNTINQKKFCAKYREGRVNHAQLKNYMSQKKLSQILYKTSLNHKQKDYRLKNVTQRFSKSLIIDKKKQQNQRTFSPTKIANNHLPIRSIKISTEKPISKFNREKIKLYLTPLPKRISNSAKKSLNLKIQKFSLNNLNQSYINNI